MMGVGQAGLGAISAETAVLCGEVAVCMSLAGEGGLIKNEGCCHLAMCCRCCVAGGAEVLGAMLVLREGCHVPSATCCNKEEVRKVPKSGTLRVCVGSAVMHS